MMRVLRWFTANPSSRTIAPTCHRLRISDGAKVRLNPRAGDVGKKSRKSIRSTTGRPTCGATKVLMDRPGKAVGRRVRRDGGQDPTENLALQKFERALRLFD